MVVGLCQKMCPKSEVEQRSETKQIHDLEYFGGRLTCVKQYQRSAADKTYPVESVRTARAIYLTNLYLITCILTFR